MTEQHDRRQGDANALRIQRALKVAIPLGIVVLLVSAVFSTVAVIGVDKAEDAAAQAQGAARAAKKAIRRTISNTATLDDLCKVAQRQRRTLVLSYKNSLTYLDTPAGQERTPLNDFVRAISLPQLKARIETERVPPSCR